MNGMDLACSGLKICTLELMFSKTKDKLGDLTQQRSAFKNARIYLDVCNSKLETNPATTNASFSKKDVIIKSTDISTCIELNTNKLVQKPDLMKRMWKLRTYKTNFLSSAKKIEKNQGVIAITQNPAKAKMQKILKFSSSSANLKSKQKLLSLKDNMLNWLELFLFETKFLKIFNFVF